MYLCNVFSYSSKYINNIHTEVLSDFTFPVSKGWPCRFLLIYSFFNLTKDYYRIKVEKYSQILFCFLISMIYIAYFYIRVFSSNFVHVFRPPKYKTL